MHLYLHFCEVLLITVPALYDFSTSTVGSTQLNGMPHTNGQPRIAGISCSLDDDSVHTACTWPPFVPDIITPPHLLDRLGLLYLYSLFLLLLLLL